ncbi:MAG TPA: alpha/beta fold hydrolase [Candidatus Paceibacterota bacterium]|nr:alpha/beta fold hydrolase [Candidatus Paceibacterota bacterium]
MQTNVLIFHGTEGYPEENWFPWMKTEMEQRDCKVFVPQFPSPPEVAAKIGEWFDVLKGYEQYLDENTILIGHSLGGKFALRLLEKLECPVKAVAFVGTPIGVPPIANNERDNAFTGNDFDWDAIRKKAKHFMVYQSDTDPYVGLDNGKELARQLGVELSFVPNAGHFNAKAGYTKFDALRDDILKIL